VIEAIAARTSCAVDAIKVPNLFIRSSGILGGEEEDGMLGNFGASRRIPWLLGLALLLFHTGATAHPGEQASIRLVLLDWANGVARANRPQVEATLSDGFEHQSFFGPSESRAGYLAAVAKGEAPIGQIDLRHAKYAVEDDRAQVGDILGVVMQTTRVAVEASLTRIGGVWRIDAITQQTELPASARRVYPEQLTLQMLEVEIIDSDLGSPISSRISVEDDAGLYWAPEGHMRDVPTGWREDVGHDVVVGDRTWAYVAGRTRLRLPPGSYSMAVTRGFEYTPITTRFEMKPGEDASLRITLVRWSNIREERWYSGDTHVHFVDPEAGLLELLGEDLNVLNILASKWGPLVTNVQHFTGAPSLNSLPNHIVYVGEETRHGWLGHSILLGIKRLVYPLTWGAPSEGVPGGFDHPPMATQADAAHAQGGLVSAAHFPWPNGELAVDIALGKLDSVDIFTWGDAFSEDNVMPAPPAVATWYRYLNCGFDLPATAGTDKMYNTQVSGSVRVYAKVEGAFNYEAWLDAIRAGRTFVTTAPILTMTANGHEIGETLEARSGDEIRVKAHSRSRIPVARLEIVDAGRVIATAENPNGRLDLTLEVSVPIERSTWLAARAYSPEELPYQAFSMAGFTGVPVMAHTSPIYVSVDGAPRRSPEDARVLLEWVQDAIEWARSRGRFESHAQREEMIDLFQQAEQVYRKQLQSKH